MVNLLPRQARTESGATQNVFVNQKDPALQEVRKNPEELELCVDSDGNVFAGRKQVQQAIHDLDIED